MAQRLREAFGRWTGGVIILLAAAFWMNGFLEKRHRDAPVEARETVSAMPGEEGEKVTVVLRHAAVASEEHGGMPRALAEALGGDVVANARQIAVLYEAWGRRNGSAAVTDALTRRSELRTDGALEAAFGGWLLEDPEAGMDWVEHFPMGMSWRVECARAVLRALPEADLAARGSWVARFPDNGALISEFVLAWGEWEPGMATDWLMQLADGEGKFSGLSALVRRWADDDPDAVSRFIVELPTGDSRDHAIAAFVAAIVELEPEAAGVWVRTIGNSEIRERASILVGIDDSTGELIGGPRAPHLSRKPRK